MPRIKIDFDGVEEVRKRAGRSVARRLERRVDDDLSEGIDAMAERSYEYAPKDTTALANSILASVHKEAPLTYVYGSHMPYAQRQEYEHKTKRGYFRRSVNREKIYLYEKIEFTVKHVING